VKLRTGIKLAEMDCLTGVVAKGMLLAIIVLLLPAWHHYVMPVFFRESAWLKKVQTIFWRFRPVLCIIQLLSWHVITLDLVDLLSVRNFTVITLIIWLNLATAIWSIMYSLIPLFKCILNNKTAILFKKLCLEKSFL
jgi:hypothetical protein